MKSIEFMTSELVETDPLIEIRTIHQLVPPTPEIINTVIDTAIIPVEHMDDTYYGLFGNTQLVVAVKTQDKLQAYGISILANNSKSPEFSTYMTPRNLYSWADDRGRSALKVIRAMIRLSSYPVLSDIELSVPAKKFLQRKVETGELNGQIFNLSTGEVTAYNPDIWFNDDDYRVLIMEHGGRNHLRESLLMPTGSWNWRQIIKSRVGIL